VTETKLQPPFMLPRICHAVSWRSEPLPSWPFPRLRSLSTRSASTLGSFCRRM